MTKITYGPTVWCLKLALVTHYYFTSTIVDVLYSQLSVHHQLGMWRSSNSNSTTFELRTFSADSKFVECFKCFVVECEFVEKSLFYDWFVMHSKKSTAARERRETFSKIQLPITTKLQLLNVQHNFCSVTCYTLLIWILIILTLGNNILSHSFNWHT